MKRNKINPKLSLRIQPVNKKNRGRKSSIQKDAVLIKSSKTIEEKKINRLSMGPSTSRKKKKVVVVSQKISKNLLKIKDKNVDNKRYKKLSKWKNILKGHTAFLLGNALALPNRIYRY